MPKSLFPHFTFAILTVVSLLVSANDALGQCGTHFRSDYWAADKIRRYTPSGGNFELQDWTGDGRSDFWNFRFNQATQTSEVVVYPALPTGYWNWDAPIVISTSFNSQATTANGTNGFQYLFRDFDGDGWIDMLANATISGITGMRIHRNMNNVNLVPLAPLTAQNTGSPIDYYDVNGDGRLDWIHNTAPGGVTTPYICSAECRRLLRLGRYDSGSYR